MAWIIFGHFKMPEITIRLFNLRDLMNLELRDDNLAQFNLEWDEIIAGMKSIPAEDVLETCYSAQFQKCRQFQAVWDLYQFDITYKQETSLYLALKKLVTTFLEKNTKENYRKAVEKKTPKEKTLASNDTSSDTFKSQCKMWMKKGTCSEGNMQMET